MPFSTGSQNRRLVASTHSGYSPLRIFLKEEATKMSRNMDCVRGAKTTLETK